MKLGLHLSYSSGFREVVDQLARYEAAGIDRLVLPEAYSYDAVSQLGFIAARTSTAELCASILNVYSRTPALLAMTAAGLDYVSQGRFVLGLGASGPQVVEGWHGIPYSAPLSRTREVIDICRAVWRGERLEFHGQQFQLPLSREDGGSGAGKALKLINRPVREQIPILLAAMGPRSVELAAALCESWEPIFVLPEALDDAFGPQLEAGRARRDPAMSDLEICGNVRLLISDDRDEVEGARKQVRDHLALYLGGMGSRGKNFYHDLAVRYGFEAAADQVQDLYLSGRKAEAAKSLPSELVEGISLVGSAEHVMERLGAYAASGVSILNLTPLATTSERALADVRTVAHVVRGGQE